MEKERLLIYAHYYYPDVASTGQLLKELAEGLKSDFDITIICVVPSYSGKIDDSYKKRKLFYEEVINEIEVIRVRVPEFSKYNKMSRIINIIAYFFGAILATFKVGNQDYIFTISQPPILGGLLGVVSKWIKKGKLIYNIQDFNPEQTSAIKYSENTILLKVLMSIDKFSCRISNQVIVVGRDMIETLNGRFKGKGIPTHTFINNWTDDKAISPLDNENLDVLKFKNKYGLEDKFIVEYSGNIGLYYDLENIIKVIAKFKNEKSIMFVFIGDGTIKDKLEEYKKRNKLENVKFIPYQDKNDLNYSLNAGDIHWVVNAKGIKGVSVPSKLYGIMAAGKPAIGVLEKNSEARLIIEESDCGLLVEPGDYIGIERTIEYIIKNRNQLNNLGINGRKYLDKNLTKEISINKYKDAILNTSKL